MRIISEGGSNMIFLYRTSVFVPDSFSSFSSSSLMPMLRLPVAIAVLLLEKQSLLQLVLTAVVAAAAAIERQRCQYCC